MHINASCDAQQAAAAMVAAMNPGCAADRGQTGCRNLSQTSPPSSLEPGASRPPLTPQCTAALSLARVLDEYLTAQASRPFEWATHNCCHFAAGWVRLIEGLDAMPLVPTPDAMQAWRLIASYGGLADAITQELGRAPIAPAEARLGDVVLMPLMSDRASVGISNGRVSMFLADDGSVLALPTLQAVHAWRIGAA